MFLLRPSLLDGRSWYTFLALLFVIFSYSLLIEYHQYTKLSQFDDTYTNAVVLQESPREKEGKPYLVLKARLDNGTTFFTSVKPQKKPLVGKEVKLHVWMKADFLDYLKGFYLYSRLIEVYDTKSFKSKVNDAIKKQHTDVWMQEMYGALFLAEGMSSGLREKLSTLGVSHLLAISGFHLGVLSFVIFIILLLPYTFLQNRFFPYRSRNRDLFIISTFILLMYLIFLGSVASLLRAFVMLMIGYFFHDRGLKIVSMQTLLLTVLVIFALFPKLIFSMGLWLSVVGVYFIFIFLLHFSQLSKVWQFVLLPSWVYLMMLPLSLYIFHAFSLWHPVSVLWSMLFTLFYPLSALMHFIGFGNYADGILLELFHRVSVVKLTTVHTEFIILYGLVSLMAMRYKTALYLLVAMALSIFGVAVYQVA